MKNPKPCAICGEPVKPPFKAYCSEACSKKARAEQVKRYNDLYYAAKKRAKKRPCVICGAQLEPFKKIYCEACSKRVYEKKLQDAKEKRLCTPKEPKKCKDCGKPIERTQIMYCQECSDARLVRKVLRMGDTAQAVRQPNRNMQRIAEISVFAKANNMTYGQAVIEMEKMKK